jgi:hypothetical protein
VTAEELRALLRDLEWAGTAGWEGSSSACPECGGVRPRRDWDNLGRREREVLSPGHASDCRLAAAIRETP